MNITYTWDIQSIHVIPSLEPDGYNNIVKEIYWSLTAINEEFVSDFIANSITVDIFCDKSNFINYSDLSKKQVIDWIQEILGEEKINNMKKILEEKIQSKIDYPTVIFSLPWFEYVPKEDIDLESLPKLENKEEILNFSVQINQISDINDMDDPYGMVAQAELELKNELLLSQTETKEEILNITEVTETTKLESELKNE